MTREKKARIGLFALVGCVFCVALAYGQTQTESLPLHQRPIISVVGRLALEKHGELEWLILHAKNAETYLVIGNLKEKLKNLLLELGEGNLVFVTGKQDGRSNVSCEKSYKYEYNEKGERESKIDIKCIRYFYLEVNQILSAEKSDEEIPSPKRDVEEEKKLAANVSKDIQGLTPTIIGEIYGEVSSVNLKSPIKTIEVANRDKESPLKNIVLVIGPNTRIVKKLGEEEPMALGVTALKEGQGVTAVYSRDEFKSEALFITITKE